ncbi:MAG TPA: glycosyltransferase [Blastocatellia bacterium]|nr:glycosyltransferase [Blastocatellia bacterium]
MRIYLSSGHKYPGWKYGVPSHSVHDLLAKGLAELGHEVRYHLKEGCETQLPEGVVPVSEVRGDEDILHINHLPLEVERNPILPWVHSVHSDLLYQGVAREKAKPNYIYVSQTLARIHQSDRYVWNGLDPADFIYSETKSDYFLFVCAGDVHKALHVKGLDLAFRIASDSGVRLKVAGGTGGQDENARFGDLCRANGAIFLRMVHGKRKAELFAGAKALLFPTQANEAFGLPIAEALVSGTPVIASDKGAIPELLDRRVGFACSDESDYRAAVENLKRIAPIECRRVALERFHYLAMAQGYVAEYQKEIGSIQVPRTMAGGTTVNNELT